MVDGKIMYYKPQAGRCGDFMPFYWEGKFHLYYLRDEHCYHISTCDLVHFTEHGVALPGGGVEKQDRNIWTGCILEKDQCFHFFYTGYNGDFNQMGKHTQSLLHATSKDLIHWDKDDTWSFVPDTLHYNDGAWRDPCIVFDDASQEYFMVLTAPLKSNTWKRWGCTPLYSSKDLIHWTHKDTLYAPGLFDSQECPDLFRIGEWWYLVFSTYTRQWETRYRMAKSIDGPWIAPPEDMFDGRAFYAAKTACDGQRRLIFGWASVKDKEKDEERYQWGGNLVMHELVQRPDGTLGTQIPAEIDRAFSKKLGISPTPRYGHWEVHENVFACDSTAKFSYLELGEMPSLAMVHADISWEKHSKSFGLMLRAGDPTLKEWYQIRIEPERNRVLFDRSNRFFEDVSFIEERMLHIQDKNTMQLKVVICGTIFVIYANDVALTARGYDYKDGAFGIFAEEGSVTFSDVCLHTLSPDTEAY